MDKTKNGILRRNKINPKNNYTLSARDEGMKGDSNA